MSFTLFKKFKLFLKIIIIELNILLLEYKLVKNFVLFFMYQFNVWFLIFTWH